MLRWSLYIISLLVLASCKTNKINISNTARDAGYCYPSMCYKFDTTFIPVKDIAPILNDKVLTDNYTIHDITLANAIGMLPALQKLAHTQNLKSVSNEKKIAILEEREKIVNRLLIASTAVSSIAAELDCEGERANQLASFMDDKDDKRIKKLTAFSIILGAAAGVVTNVLQPGNAYYGIGVTGGVISGALALVTLSKNKKAQFYHERNLLAEIWYESDTTCAFPPFVWYILSDKEFSNDKKYPIRYNIKHRWEKLGRLGKEGTKKREQQIQLLFGKGGEYSAELLHIRSDMIDQLQSSIRLLNQDLESLIIAVSH